ncbi:unnamed protein product (macronuclear) [Paramecium tetraurelia]|uniref:PAS domain-containing protein n=1 Tax=Paramecium tetraurelia TaxID=5888 RepID=A0CIK6_PARTE|nr:uncharacterized protein GSPATT00007758001 [Paramecium tetraurelia]CAK70623.1 unnamed protein product [Paramecium tetraurelia]|eukprot:XP_001438020.1 hypothetical protein (macronuclear) [Paramecium tetraurelia strain d4-2]
MTTKQRENFILKLNYLLFEMLEKIPSFLQKLIENYLDFFAAACYQRNQLAVQLFRIAVIINGLQELSLMEDNLHQSDTILFYSSLKESLPTTQLIRYESKSTLSILLITHIIINFLIFVNLFFIKKQSYFHTVTLSIILVENYILLYPTLKAIFYFNKLQADYEIYLISIFNLIMYVQIAITQYSWRQTKLIDLQGLVRTNNLKLELLSHLILMLAVGFNELSKIGSYILIMIKQIIKLGLSFDQYNQNSQFMLYQNVTQIIFMTVLYFNINMIYTLLIFAFVIQLIHKVQSLLFENHLIQFEISLKKCQIYELIFNQSENTSKILLLQSLLQKSFQQKQKSKTKKKQTDFLFTNQQDILQQLIRQSHFKKKMLIQIFCNYDLQNKPQKTLIQFMKYYKVQNIYDRAYGKALQKQLNYIINQNQSYFNSRVQSINMMDNETTVQALIKSENAIDCIQKVVQSKISLLESLRKGFQQQIEILDQVDDYTNNIFKCRNFILQSYDLKRYKLTGCQCTDILSLRILQMYFGIILNDIKESKVIEKLIEDIIKADKILQDTTINNQILLQNRFMVLNTSLINQRGKLINCNKQQISQFFGCSQEIMQNYQYIHEFMPDFIAQIHDELIDQFIDNGYTQLMKSGKLTFIQDPQNYLMPIYIHLYNPNIQDDFTLYSILTTQFQQQDYVIFDSEGKIQGISKRFFEYTKLSKSFAQDINIYDIVHRGSSILYYFPNVISLIKDLKNNIDHNINNTLNNVRSFWQIPDNHLECLSQTHSLINYSQRMEFQPNLILGQNIKLLDQAYSQSFINTIKKKQNNLDSAENHIEMLHNLSLYIIGDHIFFLITIKEYKLADFTKTYTSNSIHQQQNPFTSFSTHFTQLDQLMSEKQLTTDNGTIQDIKQFCTFQHSQIIEKLFKDDDMSGRFVVDITQKQQLNASHSQSKLPFLSSRQPLSNRQLLQTGLVSIRMVQPQFHLPSIDSKKKIEDYQLYELEEDMKEIAGMESIKQIQVMQNEQEIANQKQENINFNRYDSNVNEDSIKMSEKQNDSQVQALVQSQIQQGSQLQMIQQIVNFNGTMKMVNIGIILNLFLALWIFIMLFVNEYLINNEIQTYFHQLTNSIGYQSLQFYIGIPYTILLQLYMNDKEILNFSPALLQNTISKVPFLYGYSQIQQSSFQDIVCSQSKYYDEHFADDNECSNYFIQFHTAILQSYLQYEIDETFDYELFKANSFYRNQSFYGQKILLDSLTNFISSFQKVTLKDTFLILLMINLLVVTIIYVTQFQMTKSKQNLKQKFYQILNRLSFDEIVELIARFSCFKVALGENAWKLINYYDMINYNNIAKEKSNLNAHKKYIQLSDSKLKKKTDVFQIITIVSSFCCWILFFVLGFLLFYFLFEEFAPSFRIAQNFVAFKQKLDLSLCIGFWIKTDPLTNMRRDTSEQQQMISLFLNLTDSLQLLLDEISTDLVKSTYLNEEKMKVIQQTLNSDLCPSYQYLFCYPEELSVHHYYDSESYASILAGGITGFVAQVYKFSVSEFTIEKETLQYSPYLDELQVVVQEQVFKNLFVQYIQDIQYTMYSLFSQFNDGNSYAGETLLSYMNYYSFGFGISLIVVYNIIDFIRIRQGVKELDQLKFILLVLPEQKFENQIIKQKITEIGKYFF